MNERIWIVVGVFFYLYTVTCVFFTAQIARMKGRGRGWGWLALFFGVFGLLAVCFLPNARGVTEETNPVRSVFRHTSKFAKAILLFLIAAGLIAGAIALIGGKIGTALENRSREKELTAGTVGGNVNPAGISGSVQTLFAGDDCSLAVTEEGNLYGWGAITLLTPDESGVLYTDCLKAEIVGGTVFVLGKNHVLYAKGDNSNGMIPLKEKTEIKEFSTVERDVKDFALGNSVAAILKQSGNLYITGTNHYGQLGITRMNTGDTETLIASDVKKVLVSARTACYLKTDGGVWALGNNAYGQFGQGHKNNSYTPVKIAEDCADIALGDDFLMVLKKDGSVWTAGNNAHGQLGRETETPAVLEAIPEFAGITAIYAGGSSAFAQADETLFAWGANELGQLGNGKTEAVFLPEQVSQKAMRVSAGGATTLLFSTEGKLQGAGDARNSKLGRSNGRGFHDLAAVKEG